ncbi:nitroreductase [Phaeovulum sp. NW3]|uniref:nitroreductase family protein n=1 Tax=Phaeovulum sp. NW3 TaxID=2934933 RepID=UPI00201FE350|nr:nitroreductase [Phaeovulum sp. NW3]MCL7464440.1 nitroreductase [Phaeovulum sp. NW3]
MTQTTLDFLLTRRSHSPKTLTAPVPTRAQLEPILTAAARVPDHGMLTPWRFIVLERPALARLAATVRRLGAEQALPEEVVAKGAAQFETSPLAVVVVHVPRATEKIPAIEQVLSTGAACLALVNAALASGWGAGWVTGWVSHDPTFCRQGLDLAEGEFVAGIVHIGTSSVQPIDRPRPDLTSVVTWVDA